jgi:cardiolipin synthase
MMKMHPRRGLVAALIPPVLSAVTVLIGLVHCASPRRIQDYGYINPKASPIILGPQGQLSPATSRAIMARLNGQVEPTDFLQRQVLLMEAMSGKPLVTGNKATLLIDGPATYLAMLEAIQAARSTIHFESYIFEDDVVGRRFAEALLAKQAEGVQVELIYDSVGCLSTPAAFFQKLRDGGVQVREFNPVNPARRGWKWRLDQRDHRKLLVVDGAVAFTGGVNISNLYSSIIYRRKVKHGRSETQQHAWRDTDVQIEGPVVAEFQKLFQETWATVGGPVSREDALPSLKPAGADLMQVLGSTPGRDNRFTYMMYVSAFAYAKASIHLTTPYFVPDAQMLDALRHAAERGLDVTIILPGTSDSALLSSAGRASYTFLMKSGVKLYERRHDSMLHAKTAVIDHVWSTVGSSNMDPLSFLNNDEVNAVILSPDFADKMEAMFQEDLNQSTQIQIETWNKRPIKEWVKEWFATRVSGWL